ncbi:MAG: hypothetical protein JWO56_2567 [Acidobacteria bacterium]|nr:hypothetical protein [Acidobacteriota bacterium]
MPNWLYLVTNTLYHLGLALWIGGAVVLGALVAPELFRALPRQEAGGIFGPVLRKFARLRLGAIVLVIAAAAFKHWLWETHASTPWILIRWIAIAFMTAAVVYEIYYLEGALEARRGDPATFQPLHRRSESLMKLGLLAAVIALFLS